MRPLEFEPEVDELLARLVPDLGSLVGATEEEIEQVERIAGRPLPRFYRWFLARMGRAMGPLAYPSLDFSARTVISSYDEDLFSPDPRYLLIGYENNDMMPLHMVYDLECPARDDAQVVKMEDLESQVHVWFETFREMFAWGKFSRFRVMPSAQRCRGVFVDDGEDVLSHLNPVMESLGLTVPARVPTGAYCAFYERDNAALISRATPGKPPRTHAFTLGGRDATTLRRILGEIVTESSLAVEVTEWTPPLE